MKTVLLTLPDSVGLNAEQLQKFLLQKLAEQEDPTVLKASNKAEAEITVPAVDADEIRHLVGLYYAEKATRLIDDLWDQNGWTADTMQDWVREHMRTPYQRESAA
ncbi:hypothetical protein D0N36_12490 [Hymenobacter lapidiphilus]|uniref:hypothetical protein n=1 Tax=Hymenobacter sp. CCM 8763 TaxID=2303334 RepID=UPI000E349FBF|nr:hypothetical protein [Hymenobacter sp. CCM 8763]RFP64715.1 hypothetical protein D0N36_12490 [Hymenobacter sp. CCM 8763]